MPYGLYGTEEWTPAWFERIETVPTEGKTCLGNCLVYFRFQGGCELPENGGLLGLFPLRACCQRCRTSLCVGRTVILPHWSELDTKPLFLVFRRHCVAVAGNECREHPWNGLLLAEDMVLFCALQITDFKYLIPVHFVLFCFADWQQSCAYNRL